MCLTPQGASLALYALLTCPRHLVPVSLAGFWHPGSLLVLYGLGESLFHTLWKYTEVILTMQVKPSPPHALTKIHTPVLDPCARGQGVGVPKPQTANLQVKILQVKHRYPGLGTQVRVYIQQQDQGIQCRNLDFFILIFEDIKMLGSISVLVTFQF